MSYCININSFDNKNVSIGKTYDYNNYEKIYKINKLYYKYDFNLSKELKLLTGFINVKSIKYSYKKIIFIIESLELKNILKYIETLICQENNIQNKSLKSSEVLNFDDVLDVNEENININSNKDIKEDIGEDIGKDIGEDIGEDNKVEIYFKNDRSELKLNPTKKSNLDTYVLTKNENYNKIKNYYPFINKYNISGNFILYLSVVNGKIKFYIESGELKHPMSFTKRDTTIKNVYDTKVVIEI